MAVYEYSIKNVKTLFQPDIRCYHIDKSQKWRWELSTLETQLSYNKDVCMQGVSVKVLELDRRCHSLGFLKKAFW